MTIGASLFCIATGAILMVIGVLGLVPGLVLMSRQRAGPRTIEARFIPTA